MNTKLLAVTDAEGRLLRFFMTASQVIDYTGAAGQLAKCGVVAGDRSHDAYLFRVALKGRGIKPCIPGRKSHRKHDTRRYKLRNRIEIIFGRIEDLRRVATHYDSCPKVFLSAVALDANVMFWL